MSWPESVDALLPLARAAHAAGEFGSTLCKLNYELREANQRLLAAAFGAAICADASFKLLLSPGGVGTEGQEATANPHAVNRIVLMSATELANATGQPLHLHVVHVHALLGQIMALTNELYISGDGDLWRGASMRMFGRWITERTALLSLNEHVCATLGGAVMICANRLVESWHAECLARNEGLWPSSSTTQTRLEG